MNKSKFTIIRNEIDLADALSPSRVDMLHFAFKSRIADKIIRVTRKSGKTPAQIAKLAGTSRTRVTAILNRNTGDISTDLLLRVLWALGYQTKLTFKRIPAA